MLNGRIIIEINLPQPVSKIVGFTEALEEQWPGTVMRTHKATAVFDDDGSGIERLTVDRDGPMVVIADRDTGAKIVFPHAALPDFLNLVNSAMGGPVMMDIDGATTITIEST